MDQQLEILQLIRQLSKNITGKSDTYIVQGIYEHLLNFGEEKERLVDYKNEQEREEYNEIKLSTIAFHLRQKGDFKRADALDFVISKFSSKSNKFQCTERASVLSLLYSLYDSSSTSFTEEKSSMLKDIPTTMLAEGFQQQLAVKQKLNGDEDIIGSGGTGITFEMFHESVFESISEHSGMTSFETHFSNLNNTMNSLPEIDYPKPELLSLPPHTLDNRRSLFGSLSLYDAPISGNQLDMMFSLPPLPDIADLDDGGFNITSLSTPSISNSALVDPPETKVVLFAPQKPTARTEPIEPPQPEENVWDKALQVKDPIPHQTWERMGGSTVEGDTTEDKTVTANSHQLMAKWLPPELQKAVTRPHRPFFSEAGDDAFDFTYTRHFDHELAPPVTIVPQQVLVEECLYVMQGIPTAHFRYNERTASFSCDLVRLKSTGYVSLHKLMEGIAAVGTHFKELEKYVEENGSSTTRKGLVCQAFCHGVAMFLQFIRACILNLRPASTSASAPTRMTLLGIAAHARAIDVQLAYVCGLCNTETRGAELLSYLYDQTQRAAHNPSQQAILRLFLQSAARPYLTFVHNWIYDGRINDPFGEFVVTTSPKLEELSARLDSQFWHEAYFLTDPSHVPNFLTNVLNRMYYCGMALHVLKLTQLNHFSLNNPDHSLGIANQAVLHRTPPPPLRILFAERAMREIAQRTRTDLQRFEKEIEKHKEVQNLLAKLEEDTKIERIREASYFQQQQVLQALEDERRRKRALLDQLERAMLEEKQRKAAKKEQEKQRDQQFTETGQKKLNPLPQTIHEDAFTREVIEQAKKELMEQYSIRMSNADAQLNKLRNETAHLMQHEDGKWGPPVNPFPSSANVAEVEEGLASEPGIVGTESEIVQMEGVEQEELADNAQQESSSEIDNETAKMESEEPNVDKPDAAMEDPEVRDTMSDASAAPEHKDEVNQQDNRLEVSLPLANANPIRNENESETASEDYGSHYTYSEAGSEIGENDAARTIEHKKEDKDSRLRGKIKINTEGVEPKSNKSESKTYKPESWSYNFGESEDSEYTNSLNVPLEEVIDKCLTSVIAAQYVMVNKQLMSFFIHAGIENHLTALRRFLLMQSGDFADQISGRLFDLLSNPDIKNTPHPHELNVILETSLKITGYDEDPLSANLAFIYKPHAAKKDTAFNPHSLHTLNTFHLDYTVPFPLSIVIDQTARSHYHSLFNFLLSLKRVAYALRDIWIFCKRRKAFSNLDASPNEMLELELYRHEMQHFVNILQEYVINQILDICWKDFSKHLSKLHTGEIDLNDLRILHEKYLNKAKSRCMLHEKAKIVAQLLNKIFSLILQVWLSLRTQPIDTPISSAVKNTLRKTRQEFTTNAKFLYNLLAKLNALGHQPHLQQLLLLFDYNEHYSKQTL